MSAQPVQLELAVTMEQTAEHVRSRAERLLEEAQELNQLGALLVFEARALREDARPADPRIGEDDVRAISRSGELVTLTTAVAAAAELGEFSRGELTEKLDLRSTAALGNFLQAMIRRRIVEPGRNGWKYVEPPSADVVDLAPEREAKRAKVVTDEELRDWIVATARAQDGEFRPGDVAKAFDWSPPTVSRRLKPFLERGILTVSGATKARRYHYHAPDGPGAGALADKRLRRPGAFTEATAHVSRGGIVAGTGKGLRSGSSVVNELLREVRQHPGVTVQKKTHKYSFIVNGREVASCSTTPGASALGGTRKDLRAAGIPV